MQESVLFYPYLQSLHLHFYLGIFILFSRRFGFVSPSQFYSTSLSLPSYQIFTQHTMPASLLSADGEEEGGRGQREKGRKKRELHPSLASATSSMLRHPLSSGNNEEDHHTTEQKKKKSIISSSSSSFTRLASIQ